MKRMVSCAFVVLAAIGRADVPSIVLDDLCRVESLAEDLVYVNAKRVDAEIVQSALERTRRVKMEVLEWARMHAMENRNSILRDRWGGIEGAVKTSLDKSGDEIFARLDFRCPRMSISEIASAFLTTNGIYVLIGTTSSERLRFEMESPKECGNKEDLLNRVSEYEYVCPVEFPQEMEYACLTASPNGRMIVSDFDLPLSETTWQKKNQYLYFGDEKSIETCRIVGRIFYLILGQIEQRVSLTEDSPRRL
mgnify:CR=1 FL=1